MVHRPLQLTIDAVRCLGPRASSPHRRLPGSVSVRACVSLDPPARAHPDTQSSLTGPPGFTRHVPFSVAILLIILAVSTPASTQEWGTLSAMHNYAEVFGLAEPSTDYSIVMLDSNAAGNVFHPGEQPRFAFQVQSEIAISADATIEILRYAQRDHEGDQWWPELVKLEDVGTLSARVDVAADGYANLTIEPPTPETKGGYALIIDLGEHGRQYLTSYVRTFEPRLDRIQHPKQALEEMPPEILARIGVQAIRYGVPYFPDGSPRREEWRERLDTEFAAMHENRVTCLAEIGTGGVGQPLGRGRPHLDADGVMQGGKEDLVWLPEFDDDYEDYVYELACKYGWPKGPITGFMLWNEPWEGLSISGWGADMIRYRELYRRMGDAIFRARADAGVDVLIGGCDSSSNTWDKLFPDGSDEFVPYLDFCSIHYQGLAAPVLHPEWNSRTHHGGRVLIWDTESWVANTDDRFAGVVASNRAAGCDRALGTLSRIAVSTMSHHRVAHETIRTPGGERQIEKLVESRPLAAAYGATQQFIGERDFDRILFENGLPWVYVFHGLDGSPDDGTVVVLGDLGAIFGGKEENHIFNTVDLAEGATMSLRAGQAAMHDAYGNTLPSLGGRIAVPLDARAFFLRADPNRKGSFARLLRDLRRARIEAVEPVEMIPYDLTAPIAEEPTLHARLTNQLNRPIRGTLTATLGSLRISHPTGLSFRPREQKWIELTVTGGEAVAANQYPLTMRFDAGEAGLAIHEETMRVNWISRKSITVDGKLDDWAGALPQTINVSGEGGSFEERMWLPFVDFSGESDGLATGYVAHDDEHFYFAAKVADDSVDEGTVRFAERDEEADFYPEVSFDGEKELRWPEGVRRFSYRRRPELPSGHGSAPHDNVLIAFNAIPMVEDGWDSHLPGRMPKFIGYKTTDYQYALNRVAEEHGAGTEVWRLETPGMPRKHFYPRQPKHPLEGAVEDAQLEIRHEGRTRIVECALPWSEIPHVHDLMRRGEPVKFSFRVNHDTGGPDMELARDRGAAEGLSNSFHPDWARSWPNELAFGWER